MLLLPAAAAVVPLQELLRLPAGRLELDSWPQYHGRLRLDGMGRCQVRSGSGCRRLTCVCQAS
jgi:hypothetical protein